MMFNFNFSGSNDLKELMEKFKNNSFNFDDLQKNMPNMNSVQDEIRKMQGEMEKLKKEMAELKSKKQ
jgi:hypothetical protein